MDSFSWSAAATVVGVFVAFLGFLFGLLKKPDSAWKEELEKKIAILETKQHSQQEKIDNIDKDQDQLDSRMIKRMDDLDNKIDRFVEILISYFGSNK